MVVNERVRTAEARPENMDELAEDHRRPEGLVDGAPCLGDGGVAFDSYRQTVRGASSGLTHFSRNLISGMSAAMVVWVLDGELGQGKCTTAAAFGGGRGGNTNSP